MKPDSRAVTAPCLYCGGTDYAPLYDHVRDRLGFVAGEWSFKRCTGCGSATLSPTPKVEDLPAFYPPVYTFAPELAKAGTFRRLLSSLEYNLFFRRSYAAQVSLVRSAIGPNAGKRLLDVGCGRGLRLVEFRRAGFDVTGMDFTPESVNYLKEQLNIPAVCTDVEGLAAAFPENTFDVVTAFYVLEHVVDFQATIRNCLKLLKPGGWFAGAVPLNDSTQSAVFGARALNVTEAPRHISIPTQKALRGTFEKCGYRADSIKIKSDSILACAGAAGLSLFPAGNATAVYGGSKVKALALRICGAAAVAAAVPWTVVDNYIIHRPVFGIVFAQKPE